MTNYTLGPEHSLDTHQMSQPVLGGSNLILSSTSRRAAQEGRSVGLPRPAVGGSGYPGMGQSVGLPRRDGRSEGGASPTPRCRHCRNGCPFAIVQCRHRLRTRHARRLVLTFHRLGVADRLTRANSAQYA